MEKLYRILDANINRAMEGLRVVEEIARFILEDKKLTLEIKKLRGSIKTAVSKLPKKKLIKARKALSDVGAKTHTKSELKRKRYKDIFKANIKRAQEALRSLEEFLKLIDAKSSKKFKEMRFRSYEIEKKVSARLLD